MSRFITNRRTIVIGLGFLLAIGFTASAQPKPADVVAHRPGSGPGFNPHFTIIENPAGSEQEGARILYGVSGGLVGTESALRVFDDGLVQYETSRGAIEPQSWSVWSRISDGEVRALKNLVLAIGFASMPAKFDSSHQVFDGFDYLIGVELRDGSIKIVKSETGASEDRGYTQLRLTLDSIVNDLRSLEILNVKSFDSTVPGVERQFSLLADGRFSFIVLKEGQATESFEGQLTDTQRNAMTESAGRFDWTHSRLVRSGSLEGLQYEFRWNALGTLYAVQIDGVCTRVEIHMLCDVISMIDERVKHFGD